MTELQPGGSDLVPPDTPCWVRAEGDRLLWGDYYGQSAIIYGNGQFRTLALNGGVADGDLSADGTWAAVGVNGDIVFVDTLSGEETGRAVVPDTVSGVAIGSDGKVVVACQTGWLGRATRDGSVRRLAHLGVVVFRMCLSSDGNRIAVAGGDGRIRILTADGELKVTLPTSDLTWSMAFSPDNSRLLAATRTGE